MFCHSGETDTASQALGTLGANKEFFFKAEDSRQLGRLEQVGEKSPRAGCDLGGRQRKARSDCFPVLISHRQQSYPGKAAALNPLERPCEARRT